MGKGVLLLGFAFLSLVVLVDSGSVLFLYVQTVGHQSFNTTSTKLWVLSVRRRECPFHESSS